MKKGNKNLFYKKVDPRRACIATPGTRGGAGGGEGFLTQRSEAPAEPSG